MGWWRSKYLCLSRSPRALWSLDCSLRRESSAAARYAVESKKQGACRDKKECDYQGEAADTCDPRWTGGEFHSNNSVDGMSSTALHILRPREVLWHERHLSAWIVFLFSIFCLELPKLLLSFGASLPLGPPILPGIFGSPSWEMTSTWWHPPSLLPSVMLIVT